MGIYKPFNSTVTGYGAGFVTGFGDIYGFVASNLNFNGNGYGVCVGIGIGYWILLSAGYEVLSKAGADN